MSKKIQLYCMALQDRSDRVRWLLEECNTPYENIFLKKSSGDLNTTDYRAINPMGRVPTIIDESVTLFESASICMYLGDKYSYGVLAPKMDHADRPEYLKWMIFSVGSLECVVAKMFLQFTDECEKQKTYKDVEEQCKILKLAILPILEKQDYILKSGFSVADIMLGSIIPGAHDYLVKDNLVIQKYMHRLMARPAAIAAGVFEGYDI